MNGNVELSLQRAGVDVSIGNPFADRLIASWARSAGIPLRLNVSAALEHDAIEAAAQALGRAWREARPAREGTAYEFVPRNDALVLCAVDLADAPYYEGLLPVPVWEHFFRTIATEARITVHIEVLRGRDAHHTLEAAAQAFGKALRSASIQGANPSGANRAGEPVPPRTPRRAAAKTVPPVAAPPLSREALVAIEAAADVEAAGVGFVAPKPGRRARMKQTVAEVKTNVQPNPTPDYAAAKERADRVAKARKRRQLSP